VTPVEALTLINNTPAEDRALWATAFYAGLRRGKLQARTWDGVDLAGGLISVERSWDQKQGPVDPKSAAGFRRTPIAAVLREYLAQHRVTQDEDKRALVFRRTDGTPFSPSTVAQRAERAWRAAGSNP
jgi:integrase